MRKFFSLETFMVFFWRLFRGALIVAIAVFLPIYVFYTKDISSAGLMLICFVLGLVLSKFDLIEEITVGPLTAKLQRRINEAEEVLKKLQNVAAAISEISLSTMIRTGRAGGFGFEESEKFRMRIVSLLREIGVGNDDVAATQRELTGYLKREYVYAIVGRSVPPIGISEEKIRAWNEIRDSHQIPTVGKVRSFLRSINALDEEAIELLDDYTYFEKHGDHRRPEVFFRLKQEPRRIVINSGVSG